MDPGWLTIGGLMVLAFAVGVATRKAFQGPALTKPLPMLPEDLKTEVQRLVADNKLIQAIKLVRHGLM